tara:strand:- start:139 stop:849 length:711 start_codon:yes stop_codon:yes gene_type:complete
MKKILISIFLLLGTFSIASAEVGVKLGVSANVGLYEYSGKDSDVGVNATETNVAKTEEALGGMGSIFIEKTLGFLPGPFGRLSIGYDHVPHEIQSGSESRTDQDLQAKIVSTTTNRLEQRATVTNSVQIKLDNINTLYVLANITDWLYIKAGTQELDVTTKESLDTGSDYGNLSIDGTILGLGLHFQTAGGMFTRFEVNETSLDGGTLTSTTNADNKVTLDGIDGTSARVSIGKSF